MYFFPIMKIFIFKNKKSFFGEGAAYCNVLRKFTHILWLQKLPFFYLNIWRNCFFFFPRKKVIHPFSRLEPVFESMMSEFIFSNMFYFMRNPSEKKMYIGGKKMFRGKNNWLKNAFFPSGKSCNTFENKWLYCDKKVRLLPEWLHNFIRAKMSQQKKKNGEVLVGVTQRQITRAKKQTILKIWLFHKHEHACETDVFVN